MIDSLTQLHWTRWFTGLVILGTVLLIACGGAATATPRAAAATPTAVSEATPTVVTAKKFPTVGVAATATPQPGAVATATRSWSVRLERLLRSLWDTRRLVAQIQVHPDLFVPMNSSSVKFYPGLEGDYSWAISELVG